MDATSGQTNNARNPMIQGKLNSQPARVSECFNGLRDMDSLAGTGKWGIVIFNDCGSDTKYAIGSHDFRAFR
jgi:hypothetical protein